MNALRKTCRVLSASAAIGVVMTLGACSGAGGDQSGVAEPAAKAVDGAGGRAGSFAFSGPVESSEDTLVLADRKLVKTAAIGLASPDVRRTLGELDGVVTSYQGIVETEDVRTEDSGEDSGEAEFASMVLRVPVDRFEKAVDAIAGLATLEREQTSTEDVTARVADVDARVRSAERSIAQLRLLFSRASKLGDVIALESELSQRQAALESLQARQRLLARQTALSTIHVTIRKSHPARGSGEDRQAGFVAGLASGWSALVAFVRGTAHVLGLVLPFATLAAVLALPAWLVVRRFRLLTRRSADG